MKISLPMSAIGCSDAERADAVRAVAVLEAAEQLALGEQRDRHEVEDDDEDHQRLEELHPPRLVVADLGERHASRLDGSRGRDRQRRGRRHLGEALDGGLRPATATALGSSGAGPPTRCDLDERLGEHVGRVLARALGEEHGAAGHGGAQPHGAAHARAVGADLDAVALADAEPLGVGRARARRPGAGAGSAARARRRPPWSAHSERKVPSRSAPSRGGGRRRRRPRASRAPSRAPRSCASRSGQRTPRPPISSSVRPGVERHRLEQLLRGHRARAATPQVVARRARRRRR